MKTWQHDFAGQFIACVQATDRAFQKAEFSLNGFVPSIIVTLLPEPVLNPGLAYISSNHIGSGAWSFGRLD
jgi:hypothetical protein